MTDHGDWAAVRARELFGGDPGRLPGEFDYNFRVDGPRGPAVLKLAPAGRRPAFELLAACLDHLRGSKLRAQVPARVVIEALDTQDPRPNAGDRPSGAPAPNELGPDAMNGPGGAPWVALAVTFVEGATLAAVRPRPMPVLEELGALLAELHAALDGFRHPGLDRPFPWRLESAPALVRRRLDEVEPPLARVVAETVDRASSRLEATAGELPAGIVHNDANDHNVLVAAARSGPDAARESSGGNDPIGPPSPAGLRLAGLIDFGDAARGWRVADPAVAAAYAMMDLADPLEAACAVARGYASVAALSPAECRAFVPLAALRLCLSVCIQARQMREQPGNEYLAVSQRPARRLLRRLAETDWRIAEFAVRDACDLAPNPGAKAVVSWLRRAKPRSPVLPRERLAKPVVLDMSVESLDLPHADELARDGALDAWIASEMAARGATVGVGRYGEARLLYDAPAFAAQGNAGPGARTVHMGLDLFAPAGVPVRSPLPGAVVSVADNAGHLDYGPTVVVRHATSDGALFHTLYGHLSKASLAKRVPGEEVRAGDVLGWLGTPARNGGWPPHLHFQVIALDALAEEGRGPAGDVPERGRGPAAPGPFAIPTAGDFPGVVEARHRRIWESVLPDPVPLAGLPSPLAQSLRPVPGPAEASARIKATRDRRLAPSLGLSYDRPLHIVRGLAQWLFDASGRRYLDVVNNVAHVGHANRRVADAIARQSRLLNTNTRYLHGEIAALSEEIAALLPPGLDVVFLVCSGSEANELALRLARHCTGREGVVALEGAYHGNTGGLVEISPYKFDGPGGGGKSSRVEVAPMPDPYRGLHRRTADDESEAGLAQSYAAGVHDAAERLGRAGVGVAAFVAEAMLGCGGQIEPPAGYLQAAFRHIRRAGGLCIADEVQTGFGRVGDAFWAFELQGATPDIVTLGKPMGNGHPVGAVATTREIADTFANGMEYFNTFGGNPVSCAAARAVLAEVRDRELQARAKEVGALFLKDLQRLASPFAGDARGRGLFLGVELVRTREGREPFPEACRYVVNRMRERGILMSADGPDANVLKIKPPLVFDESDAARVAGELDAVLRETPVAALIGTASEAPP